MIKLTFSVDSIDTIIQVYNQIQVQRAFAETGLFTTISGLGPVSLIAGISTYTLNDASGTSSDWYIFRYYSTVTTYASDWSDPVLGEQGDIFYNPLYPDEINYGTAQQLVINRIRRLIGDPVGLRREYGEEALSSIHDDGKTYQFDEKGWPAAIFVNNIGYNTSTDPTVNGYTYLRFNENVSTIATISGVSYGIDMFYYTFRFSNREIMEAYDNCAIPIGLTIDTASQEAYMLQTAIDLLFGESLESSVEDGAIIRDEGSLYDPSPGLAARKALIDKLQKRLDDLIKSSVLSGIFGVRVE